MFGGVTLLIDAVFLGYLAVFSPWAGAAFFGRLEARPVCLFVFAALHAPPLVRATVPPAMASRPPWPASGAVARRPALAGLARGGVGIANSRHECTSRR